MDDLEVLGRRAVADPVVGLPDRSRLEGRVAGRRRRRRFAAVGALVVVAIVAGGSWMVLASRLDRSEVVAGSEEPGADPGGIGQFAPEFDDVALAAFFEQLPTSELLDDRATLLVVLDPSVVDLFVVVDAVARGVTFVEMEATSGWSQESAYADFVRFVQTQPDLEATLVAEEMPHGFALIPRFANADLVAVADELVGLAEVVGVVELIDPSVTPVGEVPLGWEELAGIDADLARFLIVEAVGDLLVAINADEVITIGVDGRGAGTLVRHQDTSGPITATPNLQGAIVVPVDDALVVLEGTDSGRAVSVFDLATLTWQDLDDRPIPGFLLGAVWTGDEVIVVSRADPSSNGASGHAAALDPSAGTWRLLPQPPSPINAGALVAGEGRVILSGVHQDSNRRVLGDRGPAVFELIDDSWETLPSTPINGQAAIVAPTDNGLIAWNYGLESAVYDGTLWLPTEPLPGPSGECHPGTTVGLKGVITDGCGGLARFDPTSNTWQPIAIIDEGKRRWQIHVGATQIFAIEAPQPDSSTIYTYRLD